MKIGIIFELGTKRKHLRHHTKTEERFHVSSTFCPSGIQLVTLYSLVWNLLAHKTKIMVPIKSETNPQAFSSLQIIMNVKANIPIFTLNVALLCYRPRRVICDKRTFETNVLNHK